MMFNLNSNLMMQWKTCWNEKAAERKMGQRERIGFQKIIIAS